MTMAKVQIKSVFEQISERVFTMTDVKEAKTFISEFVNERGIDEEDKQQILKNVDACKNIMRLQTYICNSLLKYEGMGMNQIQKTAREAAAETAYDE
jgi:hypothetical protein